MLRTPASRDSPKEEEKEETPKNDPRLLTHGRVLPHVEGRGNDAPRGVAECQSDDASHLALRFTG